MRTEIASTKAVRQFGDCLARVRYRGERFVILKNDEPVAELGPVAGGRRATWGEVMAALGALPVDESFADDLEKVNAADQVPLDPWA